MATVAELLVKIAADTDPLKKELRATKRQIRDAFGSDLLGASSKALTALAGIGAGIAAMGVASVKSAAKLQNVQTAFNNMLGSGEKAAAFVKDLQNFAARTPFEFSQVSEAAQKFLAFGFTAEQVIPTLTAVGDAAAGVGLGADGVNRVTLAIGQMAAKSKVQGEEMLQLTEAGIPAWQMLADKIGTSVPEAMDKVSKGAIDAQTGISALVEGMEGKFGGMMAQQSQTIQGTWSTMMDGIEQSMAQIGLKIADAFNLTGIFQGIGETLTNFAGVVQTSGIVEAFKTAIPVEFQVALVTISTILVGMAIPALMLFGTTVVGIAAPLLAAIAAAAPFIAAAAALAAGLYLIWQRGITAADIINALGIKMELAGAFTDRFKRMVSGLGDMLQSWLTAAKPLLVGFGAVLSAVFYLGMELLGMFINLFLGWASVVMYEITLVAGIFQWGFDVVGGMIKNIADVLGDMADSILPEWAKSSLSTISDFVGKAVGWLNSLISKITDTNNALGAVNGAGESKKAMNGEDAAPEKEEETFKVPGYEQFKNITSGETGGKKGGGKSGKDLAADARQISKTIEDEWYKTFQSQSEMVDRWYAEEIAALDKSAAANANYERDKQRLSELYSQKRLEALQAEAEKETEIRNQVKEAVQASQNLHVEAYGSASQQGIAQMQSDYDSAITNIENRYASMTSKFISLTNEQKAAFLAACDEQGLAYEIMENGQISFAAQANADKLAQYKAFQDLMTEYFAQGNDTRADLQDAYNNYELEKFIELWNEKYAAEESYREAQKTLMDTYQEAYLAAHATTMELIADLSSTALGGLSDAFTNIMTGAKSAKAAFTDLGKAMIKTIAQYFANMMSGMIVEAALGDILRKKEEAKTVASAGAALSAWAPAAVAYETVHPGSAARALAGVTTAVGSAAGLGAALSGMIAGGKNGDTGADVKVPGYASGGYFTKPLFGILGEGKDEEVALPLNRAVFENIADGIVNAGGGSNGSGATVQATLNNYGDINNGSDLEDMFIDLNSTIAAGLRGV